MQKIKFCFTSEKAKELYNGKPPQFETPFASGFDLRAVEFDVSQLKDFKEDDKDGGEALTKDKQYSIINNGYIIHHNDGDDDHTWSELLELFYIYGCAKHNDSYNNIVGWEIYPQGRILIKTGIRIELPLSNKVGEIMGIDIRSRSGLASKHGLRVFQGVGTIDNDYRGELGVIFENAGHEPYEIKIGDKIAQGVFNHLKQVEFEEISQEEFEKTCCNTKRGSGGFGSTGK